MYHSTKLSVFESLYKIGVKPLLFHIDPEKVHGGMTGLGELLGKSPLSRLSSLVPRSYPSLQQRIDGVDFDSPIGLSAGFDYNARLTQVTPLLGFGFHTVGTITRYPYGGNPRPILGRLPHSQSLMVNKGFMNRGVECIVDGLSRMNFSIPVGISIGRTNSALLKTHQDCIVDIVSSFVICEHSRVNHSYYELNISCPNLVGNISFYEPEQLEALLLKLDILMLQRPLYIKMPIECDDRQIVSLLDVISKHRVHGVIFGNLQKKQT